MKNRLHICTNISFPLVMFLSCILFIQCMIENLYNFDRTFYKYNFINNKVEILKNSYCKRAYNNYFNCGMSVVTGNDFFCEMITHVL